MSDLYRKKSIRVPVKYVDGNWEYFYGGSLPVKNGAIADIVMDESSINEPDFIEKIKRKSRHKILEEGVELLVALTIKPEPELDDKLRSYLVRINTSELQLGTPFHRILLSSDTQFVRITIGAPTEAEKNTNPNAGGGIWLDVQGLQPKGITTSSVNLPLGVSDEPTISLNHAFTKLSEVYEPWRKSHTGNIYERIFYKEKNDRWYPLEVLRNAAIVKDEHQLIQELWTEIAKELGINQI